MSHKGRVCPLKYSIHVTHPDRERGEWHPITILRRDWDRVKVSLPRTDLDSHQFCDLESDRLGAECHPQERDGHSPASLHTAASLDICPYSRMEKLGSEIATVFTHSHVVSLVVSFQPSSSSPLHLSANPAGSRGVIIPLAAIYEAFFWPRTDT